VYGDIEILEFRYDIIPLDSDVFSLNMPDACLDLFVHEDQSNLYYIAKAILKLENHFGRIKRINGIGEHATVVQNIIKKIRSQEADDIENSNINPAQFIDRVILLDRIVDMVTPMCTQLTYEGLIDEVFGIQNSYISVNSDIVGSSSASKTYKKKVKVLVNGDDVLYAQVRNLNFSVIGPLLSKKAKELEKILKERRKAKTVSEFKTFVSKLGTSMQLQYSLQTHTNLTDMIMSVATAPSLQRRLEIEQQCLQSGQETEIHKYIEECILQREPIEKVLRLLSLLSLTHDGLKKVQFDQYRKDILQVYGFEYAFALNNLVKIGLLTCETGNKTFARLRKELKLIVADVNDTAVNPDDIAYTYSGYAPLSVRLIQQTLKPVKFKMFREVMALLPSGSPVETSLTLQPDTPVSKADTASGLTIVFYIGGITFAEIAALRWLKSHCPGEHPFFIIIPTTSSLSLKQR